MTDTKTLAAIALEAVRAYEAECEKERKVASLRAFGHAGAFVPAVHPTEEGRRQAIADALAAVLGS